MSETTTTTATPETPSTAPTGDREAMLREAFPSMYPAAQSEPTSPAAAASSAEPAAPTSDPPAAEPVALGASGLSITLPAGVAPDTETLQAFDSVVRDLGLDAAAAQRLVDVHSAAAQRFTGETDAAWEQMRTSWRQEAQKDSEIGGASFEANVKLARATLDRFGGPGLKQALKDLGIGNHPELVRLLVRVGRAFPEAPASRTVSTSPVAPTRSDRESMLRSAFPSMFNE